MSQKSRSAPPIAYVVMGFPVRSETAVVREMHVIDEERFPVHVFSVRPTAFGEGVYEPKADRLRPRTLGLTPRFALKSVAATTRRLLRRDPRLLGALGVTLRRAGPLLPKALVVLVLANGMADEAKARGIGYIHGNFASFQAFAAWVIGRLTDIPYGFTMHAHDLFIHGFMMEEKVREAAVVVSISQFNVDFIRETWGIPRDGVEIVHCGIDLSEFTPVERVRGDELRLLSVGRLTAMKGFPSLLDALSALKGDGGMPVRLDLVGGGEDEAALRQRIDALGLGDRVTLHVNAPQAELKALYQAADVYVQPSIRLGSGLMEGVPATLMEAMAVGLPCISTRLSGIPEVVADGETGILVEPERPDALAEAITWMRDHPTEAQAMGAAGRRRVEEGFDAAVNARQLADLIEAALARRSRP